MSKKFIKIGDKDYEVDFIDGCSYIEIEPEGLKNYNFSNFCFEMSINRFKKPLKQQLKEMETK